MPKYKKGDRWSAKDAQYVFDGVEKLLGTYDPLPDNAFTVFFGKADADIEPDTNAGTATVWDTTVSPPVETTEQVTDLTYDWLSDEKISSGKEIIWADVDGFKRIVWAECEPPLPPNIATIVVSPRPATQILTTTYEDIVNMTLEYSSGSGIVWDGLASGFGIDEPGTWNFGTNFIAEATANNTDILMRARSALITGQPVEFFIKTAGDSVSGSLSRTFSISQADLDGAGGTVALVFEVATGVGTETINWLVAEINCSRIGADNG